MVERMIVAFGEAISILQVRGEILERWMDGDSEEFTSGVSDLGENTKPDHGIWVWEGQPKEIWDYGEMGDMGPKEYDYTDFRDGTWRQPTPEELAVVAKGENPWPAPKELDDTVIVAAISNPGDTYTITGRRDLICYAVLFLGEGQYGLNDRDDETVLPIMILGGDPKKFFQDEFDLDFDKHLEENFAGVAACLDTVLIGGFSDREKVEAELEKLDPAEREAWLEKRHDEKRGSMNDIGGYARKLGAAFRKKADGQEADKPAGAARIVFGG